MNFEWHAVWTSQRPDMLFPHCWKTYGIYIENDSFPYSFLRLKENSLNLIDLLYFSKAQASKPTWLALETHLRAMALSLCARTCPDRPALFYLPWPILWLSPCPPHFPYSGLALPMNLTYTVDNLATNWALLNNSDCLHQCPNSLTLTLCPQA